MLLNIKCYCNAGAEEIVRLTAENKRLKEEIDYATEWKHRAEKTNAELKKYERALNNACAMLYAQGVESPFSDEDWHLQQAAKVLQEEKKDD